MTWELEGNQNKLGPLEDLLEVCHTNGNGWPTYRSREKIGVTRLWHSTLKFMLLYGMVDQSICTMLGREGFAMGKSSLSSYN
jgi:hypothetical protein